MKTRRLDTLFPGPMGLAALRVVATVVVLGQPAVPIIVQGQARDPTRVVIPQRVITPDSARLARLAQVRRIPDVIGMTLRQAIDSLRWTKMEIVQRDSTTTRFRSGTVVDQRPKGGTIVDPRRRQGIPSTFARAETLFVAIAPQPPDPKPTNWRNVAGGIVATTASPVQPPPKRTDADVGPSFEVPTRVPTQPGGGLVTVPGTRFQDRTQVPNLRDHTPRMVASALGKSRLNLGRVSEDYSDEVDSGRVFRQQPPATREAATNTKVDVWYSTGPHRVVNTLLVPRVVGLTLAQATASLTRAKLRTGYVDYLTRSGAEGKVVHQVPQEGQPAHANDSVDLTITNPPVRVAVPPVVGKTRRVAQQLLENAGLGVGSVTLVVLPRIDTVIVEQTPAAGATADSGTLVNLVENRPPERRRVIVSDLTGRTLAEAESILKRDSLVLGDVVRPAVGAVDRVIDQQPKPGDSVFMQSPVTVALGTNSGVVPTTEVPPVVSLTVDSARHVLANAGFTHLSISAAGDTLTSASIVESQIPEAGRFASTDALVSLVARSPPSAVPNLLGMRSEAAKTATEIDGLEMIVTDRRRGLRLHDEVVHQDPAALSPRPPDGEVDVTVAIPVIPPLVAAILGFGVVVGGGAAAIKKWPDGRGPRPPATPVALRPEIGDVETPVITNDGRDTIIKREVTLRVDEGSSLLETQTDEPSIIKRETPPHA